MQRKKFALQTSLQCFKILRKLFTVHILACNSRRNYALTGPSFCSVFTPCHVGNYLGISRTLGTRNASPAAGFVSDSGARERGGYEVYSVTVFLFMPEIHTRSSSGNMAILASKWNDAGSRSVHVYATTVGSLANDNMADLS